MAFFIEIYLYEWTQNKLNSIPIFSFWSLWDFFLCLRLVLVLCNIFPHRVILVIYTFCLSVLISGAKHCLLQFHLSHSCYSFLTLVDAAVWIYQERMMSSFLSVFFWSFSYLIICRCACNKDAFQCRWTVSLLNNISPSIHISDYANVNSHIRCIKFCLPRKDEAMVWIFLLSLTWCSVFIT